MTRRTITIVKCVRICSCLVALHQWFIVEKAVTEAEVRVFHRSARSPR